jgi:hypothetical protein
MWRTRHVGTVVAQTIARAMATERESAEWHSAMLDSSARVYAVYRLAAAWARTDRAPSCGWAGVVPGLGVQKALQAEQGRDRGLNGPPSAELGVRVTGLRVTRRPSNTSPSHTSPSQASHESGVTRVRGRRSHTSQAASESHESGGVGVTVVRITRVRRLPSQAASDSHESGGVRATRVRRRRSHSRPSHTSQAASESCGVLTRTSQAASEPHESGGSPLPGGADPGVAAVGRRGLAVCGSASGTGARHIVIRRGGRATRQAGPSASETEHLTVSEYRAPAVITSTRRDHAEYPP